MPLNKIASLVIFSLCALAASDLAAQAAPQVVAVQSVPTGMASHYDRLHPRLQPSADAWVQSQAHAELERAAPDIAALQGAVRSRFGQSGLAAGDIDAMVFMVLMAAVNNTDNDLKAQMAAAKALTAAKDAVRKLMDEMNQEIGSLAAAKSGATCQSPFCQSLARQIAAVSRQTASASAAAKMSKGIGTVVHTTPSNSSATSAAELGNASALAATSPLTFAHLREIQTQLGSSLKSLDDQSETLQLELQMTMDRRSKLLDALSNIMKSGADANAAVIANLK
jgi:hypothetical protein